MGGCLEMVTPHHGYQGRLSEPYLSQHTATVYAVQTSCTVCGGKGGIFHHGVP